jgi:hypothetical protein
VSRAVTDLACDFPLAPTARKIADDVQRRPVAAQAHGIGIKNVLHVSLMKQDTSDNYVAVSFNRSAHETRVWYRLMFSNAQLHGFLWGSSTAAGRAQAMNALHLELEW